MRLAKADLEAARALAGDDLSPHVACSAAQQAAEKSLKAILVLKGARVPRTHNLKEIRARIGDDIGLEVADTDLDDLTYWYTESRYPDGAILAAQADASVALAFAQLIFNTVERYLNTTKDAE